MKHIQFEGLTLEQKTILECLWQCEDIDCVNEFIDALPDASKKDAESLFDLLVVDTLEFYHGLSYKEEAQEIIQRVKG